MKFPSDLEFLSKNPILLDCDPGADDALGLFLLLANANTRARLLGVTSVYGNGSAETTAENAARVLGLVGELGTFETPRIRVYAGASQPLQGTYTASTRYTGEDGLCETHLPRHSELIGEQSAGEFLYETLTRTAEPVIIVSTGNLTNLAQLLARHPEVKDKIACIAAASGYFGLTKFQVRSEWNIKLDPHAAKIVYDAGVPILAAGLDVTAQLCDDDARRLESALAGTKIGKFVHDVLEYDRLQGLSEKSILADGMISAFLQDTSLGNGKLGLAQVFPEKTGAELMSFKEQEDGSVLALDTFDTGRYVDRVIKSLRIFA